ncbi:uncharacterized protein LOC143567024 [Bidens hawaiensis]|uniref:uncharacterized protein LOC143567024 n=1 Tax=Bidens hawaiensis TaxID=980011 RepID=UPI00404A39FA
MELPTLTTPYAGEPLTLYLSASDIAIGAILLTDRKNVQTPIYYVSMTLYFQGHPINVLTEYKLKNVLSKPKLFGRLAKWAIELGEHAIEYKHRPAIKGQVLADFVTEVPQHKKKECLIEQQPQAPPKQRQICSLFTYGASSSEGSGAGLRLVNLEGHEFTYAIKLDFKSTNNETKYEAFLPGLRIAKKLGGKPFGSPRGFRVNRGTDEWHVRSKEMVYNDLAVDDVVVEEKKEKKWVGPAKRPGTQSWNPKDKTQKVWERKPCKTCGKMHGGECKWVLVPLCAISVVNLIVESAG